MDNEMSEVMPMFQSQAPDNRGSNRERGTRGLSWVCETMREGTVMP